MKLAPLLLAVSLLANVALVGVLVLKPTEPAPAAAPVKVMATPARAAGTANSASAAADAKGAADSAVDPRQAWDHFQTDDLAALVSRLRAGGFPPAVIRRMIQTLVNERFDARRLELEKDRLDTPYWTNLPGPFQDPKVGPAMLKLQREQTLMMKQLLGGNLNDFFADTEENKAMLRQQIGNIAPEKVEALYDTAIAYAEKRQQIYSTLNNGGQMLNSDREKLAAIEKDMRADLGKFLTPSEVDDFSLRSSQASYQLRQALAPLQPTEAEYRAIFPLYQAFTEQYPQPKETLTGDEAAARKAAEDLMNNQVKGLLGPDRAADYDQAANPNYNQINRLVTRLDLPLSAAAQVVAVQTDIQQRATDVRNDNTLSGADRRAALTSLAQEATTKISASLGDRGLEAYKTYGGQWIQNLVPRPPPKPKG